MKTPNDNTAITGIHHITAVAASANENFRFYTRVLGLRLVKKTVNFDDPFTYHLYYGDETGRPGTILTFFPWERQPQGIPGAGMVSAIAFSVPQPSIDDWHRRLNENGIHATVTERFGDPVIRFTDPHGLPLELVGTPPQGPQDKAAPESTGAISGFHSATLLLNRIEATQRMIVANMGMMLDRQEGHRYRFMMQDHQAPGHLLDVYLDPSARKGQPGGGTVHHIAFRTRDGQEQQKWRQRLLRQGLAVTDVRDRKYFQSIYFTEPGGVLFEIATDPPGFKVDEDPLRLGTALKLPHQYEPMREQIEAQLPPIIHPDFRHIFIAPKQGADDGNTIVALHGTGGDERDLIPMVRQINPSASIISPRGNVLENGMPRFFNRLANGVFDEHEVRRRAFDLAEFLTNTATQHQRPAGQLVALGYSNGANIAAAILMLRPQTFNRAVLLRPMLPLPYRDIHGLRDKPVLIMQGKFDTVIPADSTERLAQLLQRAGAQVTVVTISAGHELTGTDLETVQAWLSEKQTADAFMSLPSDHEAA